MKKDKAELLEIIKDNIQLVPEKTVPEIKSELAKYKITGGRVEEILSNPDLLNEDIRELALITEQFYLKTGSAVFDPKVWFNESEIKEARQFDYMYENMEEHIKFPQTFKVMTAGRGVYVAIIDYQTIAKLMKSQLLNYNYDIQRQATKVKRNDTFILTPTINKSNIREMTELILKEDLEPTTLEFNAAPLTSEVGDELVFDHKTGELTITAGTRLDVLDGFHRCLVSEQVYDANPNLNFNFIVNFTNYTIPEAQQRQARHAKATPIPQARREEMEAVKLSDDVIRILKADSELKGRISTGRVETNIGDLVNYSVLSDAIDREFKMKFKKDVYEVAEYLKFFFEYLMGDFPEGFMKTKKNFDSLISHNKIFAGHIALAAKMKTEKIELKNLKMILDQIDFNRDNPLWKKLGIINQEGVISSNINEKRIAEYFRNLEVFSLN